MFRTKDPSQYTVISVHNQILSDAREPYLLICLVQWIYSCVSCQRCCIVCVSCLLLLYGFHWSITWFCIIWVFHDIMAKIYTRVMWVFFCLPVRYPEILKIKIYKTIILPVVLYGCETWSLTLREECRLRVFENRVLRRLFWPKRDKVMG